MAEKCCLVLGDKHGLGSIVSRSSAEKSCKEFYGLKCPEGS